MKKNLFLSFYIFLTTSIVFGQSVEITPQKVNSKATTTDPLILQSTTTPSLIGLRHGGTFAAPTAVTNGMRLLTLEAKGHNGTSFITERAAIEMNATENWTSTANGIYMSFSTTANGTTGMSERMRIADNGRLGIGTTDPQKKVHISSGNSGVTPSSTANLLLEDNVSHYIQMSSPEVEETGLLFGKPSNSASGGVIYNASNGMDFRTGGNTNRVTITSAGNVGIGTVSPTNTLHVAGSTLIQGDFTVNTSFPFVAVNTNGINQNAGMVMRQQGTTRGWVYYENSSAALKINATSTGTGAGGLNVKSSGFVGIGTESPNRTLEVSDSGTPFIRVSDVSGGSAIGLELLRTGSGFNDWRMQNDGGELKFGASFDDFSNTTEQYIMGTGAFRPALDNARDLGSASFRFDDVFATNGVIQTSDRREKENILASNYGLDEVLKLNPVTYYWKNKSDNGRKLGLIAQEVATLVPEVVNGLTKEGKIGDNRLGMNYGELVPVLINAIKEQQAMIEKLSSDVKTLKSEIASLEDSKSNKTSQTDK